MEFLNSNLFMWIIVIFVFLGSFLTIFEDFFDDSFFSWSDIGQIIKKVLFFIPLLVIGIVFFIIGDFKNSKLGYIVIFIIIGFIIFGIYMGYKAGPYNPPTE